jgi:hypothetical protein
MAVKLVVIYPPLKMFRLSKGYTTRIMCRWLLKN